MSWETVIGLEVHVQLLTKSKIFSGASTAFGAPANAQACAIDLGLPGILPVLNQEAVRMAVKFGLSVNAQINPKSVFARKNYFYPDLPKGYQISQFDEPIVGKGTLNIRLNGETKSIGITRAHLEEDAGKSLHEAFADKTGIDLNRAGTGLLEIVSEPDMRSAEEAIAYLKTLHALVCYLEICDGNMQEGSFRVDANVSVRRPGEPLGTRCEIKNVNSFRFVEKAILYEVDRQIQLIEAGETIIQQTRLYDPVKNETRNMRDKENANDYRYFPDPDLLPVILTPEFIAGVKASLPELPEAKRNRFQAEYALTEYDATVLTSSRALAAYFETVLGNTKITPKLAANWITSELLGCLNQANIEIQDSPITVTHMQELLNYIEGGTLSGKLAKGVFETLWSDPSQSVKHIVESQGLSQINDVSALLPLVDQIITDNPTQVADYKAGKDKLLAYFVGQLMKQSKGKANPEQANKLFLEALSK